MTLVRKLRKLLIIITKKAKNNNNNNNNKKKNDSAPELNEKWKSTKYTNSASGKNNMTALSVTRPRKVATYIGVVVRLLLW